MFTSNLSKHIAYWSLTAVYIICIVLSYTTAQRLFGGGKILTDVHQAWWLEALPWAIACVSAIVLARLKVFRRRALQIAIPTVISFAVTLWLIFQPPAYSLDILRYLWDGRLLTHGLNPYTYVPIDAHLEPYRHWPYWTLMGWKTWPEAYPPLAQIYFGVIASFTNGSVFQYKALLLINDAVSIFLFYRVLLIRRRLLGAPHLTDKDMQHFALFLLFPPILIESFGSGHVDLFAIPWLLLAWLYRMQNKPGRTGFAIAMATCIKFYPIVLFAALLDRRDWKGSLKSIIVCALAIGGLYALFASAGSGLFAFFTKVTQMDYNGSIEYVLAKWLGSGVDKHSTLLILVAELVVWYLVLFTRVNRLSIERKVCLLGLTFILASPVLHPWYLLSLLPFAIVAEDVATLWLAVTSHFTADEVPLDMYIEYIPTYGLILWKWLGRQ